MEIVSVIHIFWLWKYIQHVSRGSRKAGVHLLRQKSNGHGSPVHCWEGHCGSWQNQVLFQVFAMPIHPGLSWALDPQKGAVLTWGSGGVCLCPNINVSSGIFTTICRSLESEWIKPLLQSYQDLCATLQHGPQISPTGIPSIILNWSFLPSLNTCLIFLNFESLPIPIFRSLICNNQKQMKFLFSLGFFQILISKQGLEGEGVEGPKI